MAEDFASQIVAELKRAFQFKRTNGAWMQQGKCPGCGQWELWTAAKDPKLLRCGRADKCGYEQSVRQALPELFEDWSKRFERTEQDPNAAADAYLQHERGIDLQGLRGAYSQEHYHDRTLNEGAATVRFPLPGGSWWERIIDRPGRFGKKKANFKFGGQHGGECWTHPDDTFPQLATCSEIWIAEGIFDALALRQSFDRLEAKGGRKRAAVSAMSTNLYPEHFLGKLSTALEGSKQRPTIVFALDVGAAGVKYSRKHVAQAREDGWAATAAMVRADGDGDKLDWNDLHLRQLNWNGPKERAPLGEDMLGNYRHYGELTIELDPWKKARLIHEHSARRSFYFRCGNRIYWAKSRGRDDVEESEGGLAVDEIANCSFRILYRERDEIEDESNFFLEIVFPNSMPTAKARFSAATCAASGEFKKRLLAFAGMWSGNQEQLDRLMRDQTRQVKTVEPIHFTGYSPTHDAWVLGDIAVRGGQVIPLSGERYFDFGKSAVKPRSEERMLSVSYARDGVDLAWIADVWEAWGERGLVVLAFFTMSLFAVQIRARDASLGFLEVHGEPGSGKTTLVAFNWMLLGRSGYEGFDPNKATTAAIARNFMKVSGLPVGLIESGRGKEDKPSHFKQFDWAELLTLFNGRSPRSTGRKTGGTETFEPPFLGSIYLMQNDTIDAMPAVLERIMSIRVDQSHWSPRSKDAAIRLERYDPAAASGWIVHVTRQANDYIKAFFDRYDRHDRDMPARVAKASGGKATLHNPRIIKCHAQLAAAVEALGGLFPPHLLPRDRIETALQFVDQMAIQRQAAAGTDHPVVQRFWEQVDYIIGREGGAYGTGPVEFLNHYRDPERIFAISLSDFERRARNLGLLLPDPLELRRHLKGSRSRKFLGAKPVNSRNGKSVHCWVFDNPAGASPQT